MLGWSPVILIAVHPSILRSGLPWHSLEAVAVGPALRPQPTQLMQNLLLHSGRQRQRSMLLLWPGAVHIACDGVFCPWSGRAHLAAW